jgi:putative Holliday junction resolvase
VKTRIIGIDFGLARIGIALSDEQKIIASPLLIFPCEKKAEYTCSKLAAELKKHAEQQKYQIEEIVVGMPLLMSGKVGLLADETLHFIQLLKEHFQIPILSWDERLTSVQAERALREGNMNRKRRSKVVDTVAAVIILQNYLDHRALKVI